MRRREIAVHIRTYSFFKAFLDVQEFLLQVLSAGENATFVLRVRIRTSRLNGFIVGSLPKRNSAPRKEAKNWYSPVGLFLACKGKTQPRRFMQKKLSTQVKRVGSVLNTLLECYFQSLPQRHRFCGAIRQHRGGNLRLIGVLSECAYAA